MTDSWRDSDVEDTNEKADKALGAAFKKDLGVLLEKYKAEITVEIDCITDASEINFYSPSRYVDGERVKANLDVSLSERTDALDLT